MPYWLAVVLFAAITMVVVLLLMMAIYNLNLLMTYRATRGPDPVPGDTFADADLPQVTVQIPVYNEGQLAAQCLRYAAALDYPHDCLEIQYLDDSDDGLTSRIAEETIAELRRMYPRVAFRLIRRANRDGFKAGALLVGTAEARGEFLAIFDADFVIPRDFLRRTIHHFTDAGIGAVQARWDYLNASQSIFTRMQADKLDAHQMFEQTARGRSGQPVIFHGTAGIWRGKALAEAGGWNCMSEVEDVEITIRATVKGWRVVYLDHYRLASELPETIVGFIRQQMRWKRGWSRVTLHYTGYILRSRIPLRQKIDLLMRIHLTWGPLGALIMVLGVLPYFLVAERLNLSIPATVLYSTGLILALIARHFEHRTLAEDPQARIPLPLPRLMRALPLTYLVFNMGMLWALAQATFEGFGKGQIWEVTPKSGTTANSVGHMAVQRDKRLPGYVRGTLALAVLGAVLSAASLWAGFYLAAVFYIMLAIGAGYTGYSMLGFFGLVRPSRLTASLAPAAHLPPVVEAVAPIAAPLLAERNRGRDQH